MALETKVEKDMHLYEVMDRNGGYERLTWINPHEIQSVRPSRFGDGHEAVWITLRAGGVAISPEEWERLRAVAGIRVISMTPPAEQRRWEGALVRERINSAYEDAAKACEELAETWAQTGNDESALDRAAIEIRKLKTDR